MHGSFSGAVWLDEWTALDMTQCTLLNALTYNGTRFIISGDRNQMGACFSTFRGVPSDADQIGQSLFFFIFAGAHDVSLQSAKEAVKHYLSGTRKTSQKRLPAQRSRALAFVHQSREKEGNQ